MIKRFLAWLKTIYFKPATAETQSPEVEPMSDIPLDVAAQTTVAVTADPTPAVEVKTGVADFEAALSFVESGVAQLGGAAKDELKALAKKYL